MTVSQQAILLLILIPKPLWIATQNNIALDLKEEEFPTETEEEPGTQDTAPVPRSEAAAAVEGKAYRDRLLLRF